MTDTSTKKTLGTVRNAALLLRLLSERPAAHQLTDLAERSGMSVPTVHRLLRSLVEAGLAAQDPRTSRYGLGSELVRLSSRYLAGLPSVRAAAPYLLDLRDATTATVLLAVRVQDSVVYVDRLDGPDSRGVYRERHLVHPILERAAGRALAAHADPSDWALLLAAPAAAPFAAADLRRWRDEPYVLSGGDHDWEDPEVAVPVLDGGEAVHLAISATGDAGRLTERQLIGDVVPQLLRTARAIGRTLLHG